jgi:hypothetical protein
MVGINCTYIEFSDLALIASAKMRIYVSVDLILLVNDESIFIKFK